MPALREAAARQWNRFLFGDVTIPEAQAGWIRAEQVEAFKRFGIWVAVANLLNAALLVIAFWETPAQSTTLGWSAGIAILMAAYLYRWAKGRRRPPAKSRSPRAIWICTRDTMALAFMWGVMPVLLFPMVEPSGQMVVATVAVGMMCGGAFMLSTVPAAAATFVGFVAIGSLITLIRQDTTYSWFQAGLLLVYIGVIFASIHWAYRTFVGRLLGEALAKERAEVIGMLLHDFEDAAADWLWSTNADGTLTSGTARFGDLSKQGADELERAPFQKTFVEEEATRNLTDRMARQESFSELVLRIDRNGRNAWIALAGKPVFENDAFAGYRGVASDETIKRESENRIAHMAAHDGLTGLPNRTSLLALLGEVLDYEDDRKASCALLLLDLDEFKRINDSLGHSAGDRLLVEAARRLIDVVATAGVVSRLGGDEFAVVLNHGAINPVFMSQKIIAAIEKPFDLGGATAGCSASVGIRQVATSDRDPDLLLKHADLALYEAKANGRRRAAIFDPRMDTEAQELLHLESELRNALAGDELQLFFQPIVAASSGRTVGSEALLRWQHPTKGLLSPARFIDVAERSGLIVPLGEWVIRAAIDAAARFPAHMRVAVNISPIQLRSPNLLPTIINALASNSVSPDRLEVEITESVLLADSEANLDILQNLRAVGVRISLDDFGTGYSSFSYLRKFEFDKIKIDKSFVDPITRGDGARAIVAAMVALARTLKAETVAEGVEDKAQFEAVRAEGCDQVQGYYFSRPLCMKDMLAFLGEPAPARAQSNEVASLQAPPLGADSEPAGQRTTASG